MKGETIKENVASAVTCRIINAGCHDVQVLGQTSSARLHWCLYRCKLQGQQSTGYISCCQGRVAFLDSHASTPSHDAAPAHYLSNLKIPILCPMVACFHVDKK